MWEAWWHWYKASNHRWTRTSVPKWKSFLISLRANLIHMHLLFMIVCCFSQSLRYASGNLRNCFETRDCRKLLRFVIFCMSKFENVRDISMGDCFMVQNIFWYLTRFKLFKKLKLTKTQWFLVVPPISRLRRKTWFFILTISFSLFYYTSVFQAYTNKISVTGSIIILCSFLCVLNETRVARYVSLTANNLLSSNKLLLFLTL